MVKFNILLTLFGISSLFATVQAKNDECDSINNYLENYDDIQIDYCYCNDDDKVTSISIKGETVTQEIINKLASYKTLEKLALTRISNFPEDLNFESIPVKEIEFYDLNAYKNRSFNNHDTPKNILKSLTKAEIVSITGYIISQTTINDLSTLTNVKTINFDLNRFNEGLDFSKLKNNKKLTSITCSRYRNERSLEGIPESICQLTQLKKLTLNYCEITTVPKCIGNLKNLEELDLGYNSITSFSSGFNKLTKLKSLDLTYTDITSIPSAIGDFKKLENLILNYNKIKKFSTVICQLKNLKNLSISSNEISSIPTCIKNLNKVKEMSFSSNKISKLPEEIFDLDNIERLDFYGNEITKIPSKAKNNKKLFILYINYNKITKIPDSIKNLKKLQYLHLNNNAITNLPSALGQLKELVSLALESNKIDATIPDSFNNLSNLRYLDLGNNVDIKGKTLTNPDLLVCDYNYDYNASENLCASGPLKCTSANIPQC